VTSTTDAKRVPTPSSPPSRADIGGWLGRWHWVVTLNVYTFLSLAITFPLIIHLNNAIAGPASDGDNLWYVWLLWLYRNTLLSGHDPNSTHAIFALAPPVHVFPDGHFNLLVGVLLQSVTSPLAAYNIFVLLSFILSGFMLYLLAHEFVADHFACFAAGFLYTFSTYHFARAAGHFGLMTLQWLPFCAWRLFALYRRPSYKNAVLAGLGIALVPLSDVYYFAYFLIPFGLLFVAGVLIVNRSWFADARRLRLCGIALLVAVAVAGPALANFLFITPDERAIIDAVAKTSIEPASADLAAFVAPSAANPFFGAYTAPLYHQIKTIYQPVESSSFLGYPLLLLAACALFFRRNRTRVGWFWLVLGVGGMILALGPALYIAGNRVITLPTYSLLFSKSFLSSYRAPNRLVVLPLLAFSLLSAYSVNALRNRWGERRESTLALQAGIVALLGVGLIQQVLWAFPYPATPLHTSALYEMIGADKEDGLLLDLPLTFSGAYQYDQTIHHKRLVNGYTARMTPQALASVNNLPYLSQFVPIGDGSSLAVVGDGVDITSHLTFPDVMRENHIQYIVMHRTVEPNSYAKMRAFLVQQLGVPFYDNGAEGLTAWRIAPTATAPTSTYQVMLGDNWLVGTGQRDGLPERYAEQDAQVRIVAPQTQEVTLSFFATPILKPRTLEVRVNGRVVKSVPLNATGITQSVSIARVPLNAGMNTVELHIVEGCVSPHDVSDNPDTRCFTVGVQEIKAES